MVESGHGHYNNNEQDCQYHPSSSLMRVLLAERSSHISDLVIQECLSQCSNNKHQVRLTLYFKNLTYFTISEARFKLFQANPTSQQIFPWLFVGLEASEPPDLM